jgi:hypothetical protein
VLVSVRFASLELPLLDLELGCQLGFVAAHFLDEALRVLAADERLELDTERESGERASSTTA